MVQRFSLRRQLSKVGRTSPCHMLSRVSPFLMTDQGESLLRQRWRSLWEEAALPFVLPSHRHKGLKAGWPLASPAPLKPELSPQIRWRLELSPAVKSLVRGVGKEAG